MAPGLFGTFIGWELTIGATTGVGVGVAALITGIGDGEADMLGDGDSIGVTSILGVLELSETIFSWELHHKDLYVFVYLIKAREHLKKIKIVDCIINMDL
jgi:hypothetical protein